MDDVANLHRYTEVKLGCKCGVCAVFVALIDLCVFVMCVFDWVCVLVCVSLVCGRQRHRGHRRGGVG